MLERVNLDWEDANMTDTLHNFGPAVRLDIDVIGQPGQRVFRLVVLSQEGAASLWLEKDESLALATAIDQFLAQLSGRHEWKLYGEEPDPYQPADWFPATSQVDLKVGQLSLGYEADTSKFVLLIHEAEADPEGPPTFTCLATTEQLRSLSRRIASAVAAGRPRCPLCGEPLNSGGHVCLRAN